MQYYIGLNSHCKFVYWYKKQTQVGSRLNMAVTQ